MMYTFLREACFASAQRSGAGWASAGRPDSNIIVCVYIYIYIHYIYIYIYNRLTSGLSAIYQRDHGRSLFPAADQWNDGFLSPETLLMQGMSGNLTRIDWGSIVKGRFERTVACFWFRSLVAHPFLVFCWGSHFENSCRAACSNLRGGDRGRPRLPGQLLLNSSFVTLSSRLLKSWPCSRRTYI